MDGLKINQRIGILRAKLEMSGKEFADALKTKRSTINNWETGNYNVKADDIENICKTFHVSADWLLGLLPENNYSADEVVKMVSDYTGLSTKAVEHLHTCTEQLNPDNTYFDIVSYMLSNDAFYNAIAYLKRAKRVESDLTEKRKTDPDGFDKMQGFAEALNDLALMNNEKLQDVRLSLRQSIDFYIQRAVDCYKRLCDSMLKGDSE